MVLIAAMALPMDVAAPPTVQAAEVVQGIPLALRAPGDGFVVDVVGPTTLGLGESAQYTVTITNLDVDANDVTADVGASYTTASTALVSADGWVCSQIPFAIQSCTRPALASGATATIVVSVEALDGPLLSVRADVYDAAATIVGDAQVDVEVEGVADLALSTTDPAVSAGAAYEASFLVRNVGSGSSDFAGPISVRFQRYFFDPETGTLGDGGVAVTGVGWTCDAFLACSHPGPVVGGGQLPPLIASGVFDNDGIIAAVIDNEDDISGNNGASASVRIPGPDPSVTVRQSAPLTAGNPGHFFVDVSNQGTGVATGPFTVVIDSDLESPVGTGSGWACSTTDVVTCTNASAAIEPYFFATPLSISGTVPAGVSTLLASATIAPGGVRSTNDTSTISVPVTIPPFDLTVDFTTDSSALTPGAPIELSAAISNVGVGEATGPVTLALQTSQVNGSVAGSGWTCAEDFSGWECIHPGPVPASTSLPDVTVTGTVDGYVSSGSMSATVSPGGNSADNNSATLNLPIERADLEVTIVADTIEFAEGTPGVFTATVTNLGPGIAHGSVTVTPSAYYSFAGLLVDGGTEWACSEEFSWWTCQSNGPIAVGASLTPITMSGTPDGWNETIRGTVSVSLDDASEGDSINNSAFVDVPVRPLVDLSVSAVVVGGLTVGSVGVVEVTVEQLGTATVPAGEIEVNISGQPLVVAAAAGSGWSCTTSFNGATCTYLADVVPGGSVPVITYSGDVEPTYSGVASTYVSVFHPEDRRYLNDGVTIDDVVEAPVDFVLAIVDDGPFVAGVETTYTVTVSNIGASASTDTVDTWIYVPPGIDIVGAFGTGWTCSFNSCGRSDAVAGGSSFDPLVFSVVPNSSYDGTVTTSAYVAGGGDGRTDNNFVELTTAFPPSLDAAIAIEPATPVFLVGNPNSYFMTVTNTGTDEFPGPFTVGADLAFGFTGIVGAGAEWVCTSSSERSISCEHPGPLPVGGQLPSLILSADLASTADAVWSEGYLIADLDQRSDNDWMSVSTRVAGESDLTIDVADTTATFGEQFSIEATVTNLLATEAVGPVNVTFVGYFYEAPGATGTDWVCVLDQLSRAVCTNPGPVPASGSLPPITFTATAGVTLDGSGDVYVDVRGATDANDLNDYANSIVTIESPVDLTIAVDDRGATIPAGKTGEIDVIVSNVGTANATGTINVSGRSFGAVSATGVGTGWTCTTNGDGVDCEHPGPLDGGASLPTLTVTVEAPTYDWSLSTTYRVSHPGDGRLGNDTAGAVTPVESQVDLTIGIDGASVVTAGQTGDYDVVVSNVGTSTSDGEITVGLDANGPADFAAASGLGWTCVLSGTTGTCTTSAPVAPGDALPTLTVTVQTTSGGGNQVSLGVSVSGGGDADLSDNFAFRSTILASPDLTVGVDDGGATFTAPGVGAYAVTVGNQGAVATVGIVSIGFASTGPIEVRSAAGDGWECAAAPDVVCSRSDVLEPLGVYPVLTVDVTVLVTAERVAGLTATATGFDANPGNSSDTETTPVVVPADLTISLAATSPWVVGRESTLEAIVRNVGTGPAIGPVTVKIDRVASGGGDGWVCSTASDVLECTHAGPVDASAELPGLTVTAIPALADEPATTVAARVDDPSDGDSSNDDATLEIAVRVPIDLTVEMSPSPDPFVVLQPGAIAVVVRNLGVESAPGPVTLVMQQGATSLPVVGGPGWDCFHLLGTTECTHPGPVPAGGELPPMTNSFDDVFLSGYPATSFSVEVDGDGDVRTSNNTASLSVPTLGVDLELDVVDPTDGADAEIGDTRTFEIVFENVGGVAPPGAATLRVTPGPGLIRGAFTGTGWSCVPVDRDFTCSTTDPVPATGSYPTLTFEVFVAGDAFPGSEIFAEIMVPGESRFDFDNRDTAFFVVNGAPDHRVELTAPRTVDVGDDLIVAAVVGNFGQVDSTGVTTVDIDLPPASVTATVSGAGWACAVIVDDGIVQCETDATVPPGASFPTITAEFPIALGAYPGFALGAVVDNAGDGDPRNNAVLTPPIAVQGIPHLTLSLDGRDAVAGRTNPMVLRVENIGTRPADGVTTIRSDASTTDVGFVPVGVAGSGWTCTTIIARDFTCTNPGPVASGGSLPDLVVDLAADGERFDEGQSCEPIEFGTRLLRGCTTISWTVLGQPLSFDADNSASVLGPFGNTFGVPVVQPVDLSPSTTVTNLHPGSRATLTTTVRNSGVESSTGPITLIQRIECGVLEDLSVGEQGRCLPGTDVVDVQIVDVTADEWTCDTADGVVTCTHPGPLGPGAQLPDVVVRADIGASLNRSNIWIAPTVINGSDTNPLNDQPEDGRLILPVPDPDLAIESYSIQDVTVGVNDVIAATVYNVSASALDGPTTVTVDLGASLDFVRVQEAEWSCVESGATTVECTHAGPLASIGRAGISLVVTPLDTGATQQTVTWRLANAADSRPLNNDASKLVRVFQLPTPTAVLGVDRTVVRVNQTSTFDASFSENTSAATLYRWDFGDGVTEFGEVATHEYQRPGVYTAVLAVSNGPRIARATQRVIVVPDEPIVARAGDDRVAEEQLPIAFDGGASLPFYAIESYIWDFGDGGSAVGRNVQHIYSSPGIYTATLTIRSGTEEATDTLTVDVREQGAGASGGLEVTVVDSEGNLVRAADVSVLDVDGFRYSARSGDDGVANLTNLPDGRFSVYAYKLGYLPSIGRARVSGGLGVAQVALKPGTVGNATLESRRLTLDEIIAAGIDVNDPANQNVFQFDIRLSFAVDPPYPEIESMLGGLFVNNAGVFFDLPLDWACNADNTSCTSPDGDITIEGEETEKGPVITVLIIPVTASFLKEFYEVTLLVANLAPKGFAFVDGAAALDLPAGLSLAPTTEPQSLLVELAPIPSGKTGVARWIVRGDVAGEYDLGASYTGMLDPVGSPILLQARTQKPVKVWGTDALNIRVRAQRQVRSGKPYLVRLGFENVSDGPIYNVGAELGTLGGDGDFEYAPWTDRFVRTDAIDPLQTVWIDIWLIPNFNGQLVACNLCARGPTGRAALMAAAPIGGEFDGGDLTEAFTGLAAGASTSADPAAVEIESRPDEGLAFSALSAGGHDQLAWSAVDGATGYEVYPAGGRVPLATVGAGITTASIPSGSAGYVVATLFGEDRQLRHPSATPGVAILPPPAIAPDDTVAIAGGPTVIDVLGNDADPNGGSLAITDVIQPEHGTVECRADGTCTYTPDDGFVGTDEFEVVIVGSNGVEVIHVVTVTVAPSGTNRSPVAAADRLTVEAGVEGTVRVLVNDSDPDADAITVTSVGDPAHGNVACDPDGTCRYTADVAYEGFDSFTYEVSDPTGATAQAVVAVTVTASTAGGTTTTTTTTTTVPGDSTTTTTTTVPGGSTTTTTTTSTTVPGTTLPSVPDTPPPFYQPLLGFPDRVVPGQVITFTLPSGTSRFRLVMYSEPEVLASGTTGGAMTATIPLAIAAGSHQFILWSIVDGVPEIRGATVEVTGPVPTDNLPATGTDSRTPLWWAILIAMSGAVLIVVARRRGGMVDTNGVGDLSEESGS